jgi:DNA-binding helix-hairpin-helix protein with protein kinase domain
VAQLTTASIRSATIQGIGQALKAALVANGITTAADFTGISYGAGSEVLINLRNGRRVHPSGIGAVKAVALETWRREVEARARRTQPTSLPPAQVQAIRLKYAQQRQSLAQEEHRVRAEAAAQQHQIRERWAVAHSAIAVELSETRDRFLQERAQADLRLSKARREARDVTWQQVSAERELSAYRKVTYWRYCACVARG